MLVLRSRFKLCVDQHPVYIIGRRTVICPSSDSRHMCSPEMSRESDDVRIVGTVVVDRKVNECCGERRDNIGVRRHDACLFGLPLGRGWLSVPPVAIGAAGYRCRCVLRDVVV